MKLNETSSRPVIACMSVVVALCGCTAPAAMTPPDVAGCDPEAALRLIGKTRPTDEGATRLTNARIVRQIEPGQMVTQDYRTDRVTIETDPATGQVVAARCG